MLQLAPEGHMTQFSTYLQWTKYAIYYNVALITVTCDLKHKRYFLFFHKFKLLVLLSHCISSYCKWSFCHKKSVHISVEKIKQGITSCNSCLHSQNFNYWKLKPKWFSSEFVSDWSYLHMCNLYAYIGVYI